MEKALRESQALYQDLVETAQDLIWQCDSQGRYTYLNPAWEEVLGYKTGDMLGKRFTDFQSPDYAQRDSLLFAGLLAGKIIKGYETILRSKDGKELHLVFNAKLVRGENGNIEGARGTAFNITDRKLAEEALRTSESFLNSIIDQSPSPMWISDAQGSLIRINQSCLDLLQITAADVAGKYNVFQDNIVEQQGFYPLLRRVFAQGETVRFELPYDPSLLKNLPLGSTRQVILDVNVSPIRDGRGKITNAVFQHVDITERKRAETALELSEKKYRSFYQSILDGFASVDKAGNIVETNQSFLEMLGYTREEIRSLRYQDITPPKWHGFEANIVAQQILPRGYSDIYEKEYIRKDGTVFPIELRTYLIKDETGAPTGMWSFVRDITDRKIAEEALKKEKLFTEAILDSLPGTFFLLDSQGKHLRTNTSGQVLSGYSSEELSNMHALDFIAEEDKPAAQRALEEVFEKGKTSVEAQHLAKDGRKTPFLFTAKQFIIDNMPCILGTGVDISERKQAEEALRQSEARFRQVVESSPLPMAIGTETGISEYVNPKFVETFGYTLEDIPRLIDWFRLAYPDPAHHEMMVSKWQETLERWSRNGGLSESIEAVVTCKDGSKLVMQIFGTLMGNKALVVFNDLTERKRMEEALEKRLVALSKPLDDAGDINFHDLFNLKDIQQIQDLFARSTGVASVITNPDGSRITEPSNLCRLCGDIIRRTEQGQKKCAASHALISRQNPDGPSSHQCLVAGLFSAGASITIGGKHIASWLIGQVRDPAVTEEDIKDYARALGIEEEEFIAAFRELPIMSKDQFQQVAQALFVFANQLSTMAYQNIQQARFITERQRMEEALRKNEKEYRSLYQEFRGILDGIPDGLSLISPDLRIVWSNEVPGLTFMGKRSSETIGQLCYQARHGRSSPCDKCKVQECFASGKPTSGESTTPEGRIFEIHAVPLYGEQGGVKSVIAVARDITARKRAEEEQARLEAQMREVQKLESLGVLAGGIAHDFNNLLMAILGNADLALLSLSPSSPARPNVEDIVLASQRAADLCRQMLAYSGRGHFVVGRHDLSEIVQEMAQILEVSVSKKASLRYSFAADLPPVEVDATQMRQVIMNLITNASDALGDRAGVISLATGVMDCDRDYLSSSFLDEKLPEGKYAYLEVADTGCGMDEETQRRIFDPFFTTKFTGRGLGLAAVLGIVRGHRGVIKVNSEPGPGTSIKVLLPAREWLPADQAPSAVQRLLPLPGGTILLVDDDPEVRKVGSQMLARLGFQVIIAANGRDGLEVFRTRRGEIDCVLLDLTMPEMGGEEVFCKLRRLHRDARVVISSGYTEQDVTQRFAGKGLAGFVQKPYTVAKLREILNRILG